MALALRPYGYYASASSSFTTMALVLAPALALASSSSWTLDANSYLISITKSWVSTSTSASARTNIAGSTVYGSRAVSTTLVPVSDSSIRSIPVIISPTWWDSRRGWGWYLIIVCSAKTEGLPGYTVT